MADHHIGLKKRRQRDVGQHPRCCGPSPSEPAAHGELVAGPDGVAFAITSTSPAKVWVTQEWFAGSAYFRMRQDREGTGISDGRNRAASSEAAVAQRHLKRLWGLPGRSGVGGRGRRRGGTGPSARGTTGGRRTCWIAWSTRSYATRNPNDTPGSTGRSRSHRLRNNFWWINNYYDDMAWLALALERAARIAGVERHRALPKLADQFLKAWVPEDGGGIPWRKGGSVLQRPGQRPGGNLPGPLRGSCEAGRADGGLDRPHADRLGDPPGVRRHQGRFPWSAHSQLLPGRGARPDPASNT